ncbi:SixA phosphatase family protein [Kitasatospora purpeofusca]|uniref:SixA phosphatase family protein n=1 Tax=Kitasatospora purpeofusca TaxID=67352 RepID=UPI0035D77D8D
MTDDTARQLVLLRHAKSESSDASDLERPLTDQGRKDASAAGTWLAGLGAAPGLALCSTAERAKETWKLVAAELPQQPKVVYDEKLYEASLGELLALVNETADEVSDLLVVGHNPGMHALAEALAGEAEGDLDAQMRRTTFPTSAIAVLTFNGSWKSVEHGGARLVAYWAPKA